MRWTGKLAAIVAAALAIGAPSIPGDAVAGTRGFDVRPLAASVIPEQGALFGAWIKPPDWSKTGWQNAVDSFESMIGRDLDISHRYFKWDGVFPTWKETWDLQNGRIPMIDWDGTYSTQIAAGSHDARIRERARGVAALGRPVFLRYFWEMDASKNLWKSQSPTAYIAAWRHIYTLFQQEGAENAMWVWCPTAWGFVKGGAQQYYPGNAYVDFVCTDGYNWYPGRSGARWRSFVEIYRSFYSFGVTTNKPLMVGEVAAQEDPDVPGRKAQWIRDATAALETQYPNIVAFVWFHSNTIYPWWVDTSESSLQAYREMAADPYFNP